MAKESLAEVLARAAELFFSEEVPKASYQREELTLAAAIQSLEQVKEKLSAAIAAVGFSREEGNKLKLCSDELFSNAVQAGEQEIKVIIETGTDDLLLTVINQGEVQEVAERMPRPEVERGRGIELTKKLMDDFLLLSTNEEGDCHHSQSEGVGMKYVRSTKTIDPQTTVVVCEGEMAALDSLFEFAGRWKNWGSWFLSRPQ